MNPTVTLETITPAQAGLILQLNGKNRELRPTTVKRYAEQMRAGLWRVTGDTIKIAEGGTLLDGQHRLYACLQAEAPFDAYVIRGLDPDLYDLIDAGLPRRPADALHIRGEVSTTMLSAALGWIYRFEKGSLAHNAQGSKMSSHAALDLLTRHPALREFVTFTAGTKALVAVGRTSITAACYYLFAQQQRPLADDFFGKLATGLHLDPDQPVYLLRERLTKEAAKLRKLPSNHIFALYCRAWIATKEGRRLRSLASWRPEVEEFPNIGEIPSTTSAEATPVLTAEHA